MVPAELTKLHQTRYDRNVGKGAIAKTREELVSKYCKRGIEPNVCQKASDIPLLNQHWDSLEHAYNCAMLRGYYLPKLKSKCVTGKYIYNVLRGIVWVPFSAKTPRIHCPSKTTKADLCLVICQGLERMKVEPRILGWTEETYPNYQWMVDVAFYTNPFNEIFSITPFQAWEPQKTTFVKFSE